MILVTRPQPEAETTADFLQAKGYEVLVDSMLIVEQVICPVLVESPQAVLFTSANGIRFGEQICDTALTVGSATAAAVRLKGYKRVLNAQGNVDDLFELCVSSLKPTDGPLVHFTGEPNSGNLVERLKEKGFQAEESIVYRALANHSLSDATQRNLLNGNIRSALFFSPRTATVFMHNLERYDLMQSLSRVTACCISETVADQLRGGPWAEIRIAVRPNQDSVLELIHPESG